MYCLFCASDDIAKARFPRQTLFNGKKFQYYQCKQCDLIFIDPLPTADDYGKMYSKAYHTEFYFKETPADHTHLYELLEKNIDERIILDYGCGDGSFLNFFYQRGYKCIGIEYDKLLVEELSRRFPGIQFFTVDEFDKVAQNEKPTVIYLGDVLEHLSRPSQFIRLLHSRLNQSGLVMAQGPIENNFTLALTYRKLISRFKTGKDANHVPYHIIFSNSKNQKEVFEKNGFNTIHYKIYETAWPFPERFSLRPMVALKWLMARTSILFSKLFFAKSGNRFIYLGKVAEKK
jgi:2-polyprenyl-3-methyl-5-hydroxy-6-metoxy-1,4-benzoquinol methylase